ncbi:hypothetical protein FNF29_02471 [Cafeteria roenbergensis]|uniref:Uncharacterized protein n=1 Tax=Cafeteria roenbergensis TaxID=33653 RepID=A0A5A8CR07_CAFRO|nr:hypothetical protein FNF29_02471 [Cafeteria roenbergensis]|eukprot:KAA0154251.1 hypothetical protein FNF29_02471 [Cafeteria roenbergensis]
MAAAKSDNAKGWALFGAVETGDLHAVAIQVLNGARVNWRNEYASGRTALMTAAARGHDDVVRFLIDRGADLDVQDTHGQTALMSAAYKSKPRVVRTLMKRGADPDLRSRLGKTARDMCFTDNCRQLLDQGVVFQRWLRRRELVVWGRRPR